MKYIISILIIGTMIACNSKQKVDLIIHQAKIYTVDDNFFIAKAMAIENGKVVAIGEEEDIMGKFEADQTINGQGKTVYPGFYDAHCHFLGYGLSLQEVDLTGTKSIAEIKQKLVAYHHDNPDIPWIKGRGWDQNDWQIKDFPSKEDLNEVIPDKPVFLVRIDGHAAWVNQKALDLAEITTKKSVSGGEILVDQESKPTGILIDKAMDLITRHIPAPSLNQKEEALMDAQKNCFSVGLTTVSDAGLDYADVQLIDSLQQAGKLKMNIYAMLNPSEENKKKFIQKGPFQTQHLTVRSIKLFADGALGSRGAYLLENYSDDPKNQGLQLLSMDYLREISDLAYQHDYQINIHCIGDGAARNVLAVFSSLLPSQNDKRWRIEHAQIVHPDDLSYFKEYRIIPSVQPTHATSDMYWADERLGKERIKYAYAYRDLLQYAGTLALGSDFPIEHINPLYGFYAAVARQDLNLYPEAGFQMENAISRKEALQGMTIWAAHANFEEKKRGSLEEGKDADFVILPDDIMQIPLERIPEVKVSATYMKGQKVYGS